MLDVVLARDSLEGALGMLLAGVRNIPLQEAPKLIGRIPASAMLQEVYKAIKEFGAKVVQVIITAFGAVAKTISSRKAASSSYVMQL